MSSSAPAKRCLIADDVRSLHVMLSSWLSQCGMDCVFAGSGEQAWEQIQQQPPHLVITDIEMPCGSGLELLLSIRRHADPAIRQIPVLVMTSLVDSQIERTVQQFGGDGLLIKPLERESVYSVVLELLAGRNLHAISNEPLEPEVCSPEGDGPISPTLRRLLRVVAQQERYSR